MGGDEDEDEEEKKDGGTRMRGMAGNGFFSVDETVPLKFLFPTDIFFLEFLFNARATHVADGSGRLWFSVLFSFFHVHAPFILLLPHLLLLRANGSTEYKEDKSFFSFYSLFFFFGGRGRGNSR